MSETRQPMAWIPGTIDRVELDFEHCYRAVASRDQRFDGWFVTAVTTTGIYCRPSCPAHTPKADHVQFYPTAAAAHRLGFRACRRCRPDAAPGSPEWDNRADVVARAMRLIADGTVDRDGVGGLATRLGYTARHVNRMLVEEVGAGPLALARAQRAQTARTLIETTEMPLAEIAFAAGFSSVRQFNETIREIYACPPAQIRAAVGQRAPRTSPGTIAVRLSHRKPLHPASLMDFLRRRAVPGIESVTADHYVRALQLPHGTATVMLTPLDGHVSASLRLDDVRDLAPAVARCRRLLDLDADPEAIDAVLAADPAFATAVDAEPGVRVPRAVDGFEMALRAVVGQQVSLGSALTLLGRIARATHTLPGLHDPDAADDRDGPCSINATSAGLFSVRGKQDADPDVDSLRPFPTASAVAALPDEAFGMPASRRESIRALAHAVASGEVVLDGGGDREEVTEALRGIPGIGTWTAGYIAMRALGDPDVLLGLDRAVLRSAARVGLPSTPARLVTHARRWAPWRSYATIRLWRM